MRQLFWPGLSLVLIVGTWVETQAFHEPPADSPAYHARVEAAVKSLPYSVGDWIGRNVPVPPSAYTLLKTNTIFSRAYKNLKTGMAVSVILVHCSDSRDIIGHFPPVCYPAQGWVQEAATPIALMMDRKPVSAVEYLFIRPSLAGDQTLSVVNFMVLPDGRFAPDMNQVNAVSQDYRKKFYGVGQVQIVVPTHLPKEEKIQIADRFINMLRPAIAEIWSGVPQL